MHELALGQVMDWVVPAILGVIAWFLRNLDTSVRKLTVMMAVSESRLGLLENRVDKLEET